MALCAISVFSVSVLTPEVEAASEGPITETKKTETNTYIDEEDDSIALARAIAMDEAKLEAVSIVEELQVEIENETQAENTSDYVYVEPQQPSSSSSTNSLRYSRQNIHHPKSRFANYCCISWKIHKRGL